MQVVPELVERNFGEYELHSDANYSKVWAADAEDLSAQPPGDGESVQQAGTLPYSCCKFLYLSHVVIAQNYITTVPGS